MHTQHRIDIHIHWFGGLRRLNIDTLKSWITPALLALIAGILTWMALGGRVPTPGPHPVPIPVRPPAPAPMAEGVALGRAYAPVLASAYGDGWTAAADALEKGGTVADARKVHQDTWRDSRERAFAARVVPAFARVLPEGAEPDTPEERAEVVKLWRDFARGLKGSK